MMNDRPQARARRVIDLVRAAARGKGHATRDLARLWVLAESLDLADAVGNRKKEARGPRDLQHDLDDSTKPAP